MKILHSREGQCLISLSLEFQLEKKALLRETGKVLAALMDRQVPPPSLPWPSWPRWYLTCSSEILGWSLVSEKLWGQFLLCEAVVAPFLSSSLPELLNLQPLPLHLPLAGATAG